MPSEPTGERAEERPRRLHVLLLTADAVDRAAAALAALRAAPATNVEVVGVGGNSDDATTDAFAQWDLPLIENGRSGWWAQSLARALDQVLDTAGADDGVVLLNDRARVAGADLVAAVVGRPAVIGGILADLRSRRRIVTGEPAMLDLACIALALAGSCRPDARLGAGRRAMPGFGTIVPVALLRELERGRHALGSPERLAARLAGLLQRLDCELRVVPRLVVESEVAAFAKMRCVVDVFVRSAHRPPLARSLSILRAAPGRLKLPLVLRDLGRVLQRLGSRLDQAGDRVARCDRRKASALFLVATLLGSSNALTNLALLQRRAAKGQPARRRAARLLHAAEALGNRFAPYHRGRMLLEDGWSCANATKALAAFELAAERGFAEAEMWRRRLQARIEAQGWHRVRRLTIGVCTARRPDKLRRCLAAIERQAGVARDRLEILVADNAPGDGAAAEVVRSFIARNGLSCRYLVEPRPGVGWAHNRILGEAEGDVIAFVDDDCLVDEHWAEQIRRLFEADPAAGIIGGMVRLHDPRDRPLTIKLQPYRARLRRRGPVGGFAPGCNLALRRAVLIDVGGYDGRFGKGTRLRAAEDLDLYHRAFRLGWKVAYEPRVVVAHDHGRRSDDAEAALWRDYGVGGGAFRMKCVLAGDLAELGRFALEVATWLRKGLQRRTPANRRPLSDLCCHLYGAIAFLALIGSGRRAEIPPLVFPPAATGPAPIGWIAPAEPRSRPPGTCRAAPAGARGPSAAGGRPPKIFGIGFHRTGTRSLGAFLERLGFRALHGPGSVDGIRYEALSVPHLRDRAAVLDSLKPLLDRYAAFSDVPFPALYRELHAHYRDARFILMTRNLDRWWSSLVGHWNLEEAGFHALNPYEFLQYNLYTIEPLHYVTAGDRRLVIDLHARHIEAVVAYFAEAPDALLKVDLEDPDIARRLSEFLDVECAAAFPRAT